MRVHGLAFRSLFFTTATDLLEHARCRGIVKVFAFFIEPRSGQNSGLMPVVSSGDASANHLSNFFDVQQSLLSQSFIPTFEMVVSPETIDHSE